MDLRSRVGTGSDTRFLHPQPVRVFSPTPVTPFFLFFGRFMAFYPCHSRCSVGVEWNGRNGKGRTTHPTPTGLVTCPASHEVPVASTLVVNRLSIWEGSVLTVGTLEGRDFRITVKIVEPPVRHDLTPLDCFGGGTLGKGDYGGTCFRTLSTGGQVCGHLVVGGTRVQKRA